MCVASEVSYKRNKKEITATPRSVIQPKKLLKIIKKKKKPRYASETPARICENRVQQFSRLQVYSIPILQIVTRVHSRFPIETMPPPRESHVQQFQVVTGGSGR